MLASKLFVITVAFLALSGCKDEKNQQSASSSSVPVVQACITILHISAALTIISG